MSSSNIEGARDRERDGAVKMSDGDTNGRAVIWRRGEGSEGRRGKTLTAERAYLSALLSFSVLICKSSTGHSHGAAWKTRTGVIKHRCVWDLHS